LLPVTVVTLAAGTEALCMVVADTLARFIIPVLSTIRL
jgi:hypothetical protein